MADLDKLINGVIDRSDGVREALREVTVEEIVAGIVERARFERTKALRWSSGLCKLDNPSTFQPLMALFDDPELSSDDRSGALNSLAYHARTLRVPLGVLAWIAVRGGELGRWAARYMVEDGHRIPWPSPMPVSLSLRARMTERSLPPLLGALARTVPVGPTVVEQDIDGEPSHWQHTLTTRTWTAGPYTLIAATEVHTHPHEGGGEMTRSTIATPLGKIVIPSQLDHFDFEGDPALQSQLAAVLSELGWTGSPGFIS